MKQPISYEEAVDLLDVDHKDVKKMIIDYEAMCEEGAPAEQKQELAAKICDANTVHSEVEEEIFYPAFRAAIGDDGPMDEAEEEHAQAKDTIAKIRGMNASDKGYDGTVKTLAKLIENHVLEEREQIFLQARNAPLDLRGVVVLPYNRKHELMAQSAAAPKKPKAKTKEAA